MSKAATPQGRAAEICNSSARNTILFTHALKAIKEGRTVLVLVDRVKHAEKLAEMITHSGHEAKTLLGKLSKKKRQELLDGMRSGDVRCVIATTVADEGLDVPTLDTVILGCPSGNVGKVQQRIGRALRVKDGKSKPIVIDLVDQFGPYQGYWRRRAKMYRESGWDISE